MAVHVSIHDVSPAWEREVELALEMCAKHDARAALLVVPNFHGAWLLDDHPAYAARLRELQAAGHEIYLHGFFHQAGSVSRRDLAWLWAQRVVSGGEAEFRDVSPAEAEARLDEGEAVLRRAGLHVDGFVAPAWAMHDWLMPILARRAYAFTEDHLRIYNPAARRRRTSVVLNFASRTPGRMISSVVWCRLAKHARAAMPARVAIHPMDMRYRLLRNETESLLGWGEGHFVASGRELFA